jgi:predicted metal-dependent hydrolase
LILKNQSLIISNDEVPYSLIRSKKRKKSIAMKVRKDGTLQINAPFNTHIEVIESFIISKYKWLQKKQAEIQNHALEKPALYKDGEKHFYHGNIFTLRLITSNKSHVKLVDEYLDIYHRKNSNIKNILNNWYKKQALAYFTKRTNLFVNSYNLPKVSDIKVRNMKARWGSCSNNAVITYNIHLIKASVESIDYVVIHELCHLIHANHGAGFYKLQSELNPYWKQQKQSLNQQGSIILNA